MLGERKWSLFKVFFARPLAFVLAIVLVIVAAILIYTVIIRGYAETSEFVSLAALAISIITTIAPIFTQPILRIEVEGEPVFSVSMDSSSQSSWFHRLLIINNGLVPAEGCICKLIELRDSNFIRIRKFDPAEFFWTHQNANTDFSPKTIFGRGDAALLDVLQEKVVKVGLESEFDNFIKHPGRFSKNWLKEHEQELSALRLYLPKPEVWPNAGWNDRFSPGDGPLLTPSTFFICISAYAKNSYAKPEWFRLKISPTNESNTDGTTTIKSQTTLEKVRRPNP